MMEADLLWAEIRKLQAQMDGIRRGTLQAKENPDRTIYALYQSNAGNVIGADVIVFNFEDKVIDTHNAVTIGAAWKFTAPASSVYLATANIRWQANAGWATTERLATYIYKGGVQTALLSGTWSLATNEEAASGGSFPIYLKTGEYIDVRVSNASGGNITANTTAAFVWCAICQLRYM